MKILRVFNNNVVLASRVRPGGASCAAGNSANPAHPANPGSPANPENLANSADPANPVNPANPAVEQVVVTGRGIGFGAHQGDEVDESKVAQIFVPADGRDPDHAGEMMAYVPYETVRLVTEALKDAVAATGASAKLPEKLTLVTALADHVTQAQRRAESGETIQYPLEAEVASLYPDEHALGRVLLGEINARVDKQMRATQLPAEEATALALHLVNAGFSTGDLSYTYQMTGVIQQMLDVIGAEWGVGLRQASISVARFITHVRYLFVRMARGEQLDHASDAVSTQIAQAFPQHDRLARKVARVAELRFDQTLTEDEIAYLTLHIARLADTERNEHD
ncbi:transcriptional antiterminator, BglG family [Corynebacterium appendicis CIP 107643]|uniref:Transcriptional antiterminator, BglG family n=1 Tax=Corynebacterium appendicis CIP 107643 TaxID=1161099 RepID=A0A1N7J6P9_9CORY|nr:PRD domain-containing protein [Corynebacterium appendicis]WJY61851.1 Transcription antiterminator LicT [Corynebacterium appendicis CIP 107643]SIS44984.1 transcriptional antiterminator, BglG family [Corynebacterium appendicis CIP 107643]